MTTTLEPPPRASAFARGRRDFRRWRRGRPFWGGFFLMLAGLELLWSSNLSLGDLEIHFGLEGFLSYLLPALLLLTGLFVWLTPKQRMFYAILGTLTAVYSLIGLNLGGFVIGMLLGVVGGALSFAWTPVKLVPPRVDAAPDPDAGSDQFAAPGLAAAEEGELADGPLDGDEAGDLVPWDERWGLRGDDTAALEAAALEAQAPDEETGRGPRLYVSIAVPLLLAGTVVIGMARNPVVALAEPCPPSTSATATPAEPTPTGPAGEAGSGGNLVQRLTALIFSAPTQSPPAGGLAPGGGLAPALAADPTPSPSEPEPSSLPPTSDPSPPPTSDPPPSPTTTATPGPCTGSGPGSGGSGGGKPRPPRPPVRVQAAPPGQPVVSSHPAKMTADLLSITGFAFDGVVDLPTAGGGTIRALRFRMATATSAKFKLLTSAGGHTRSLTCDPLVVSGNVAFYASRFTGTVAGTTLTLTYTTDAPPAAVPPVASFTDVSLDLVYVDSDTLSADKFAQTWLA